MPTACPPPDEQVLIADAIDQRTATIKDGMERIQREIALLHEYRSRLISDVVTGKLDVREAAARLPDEAEEPEPLDEMEAQEELEEDVDVEAEEMADVEEAADADE